MILKYPQNKIAIGIGYRADSGAFYHYGGTCC